MSVVHYRVEKFLISLPHTHKLVSNPLMVIFTYKAIEGPTAIFMQK